MIVSVLIPTRRRPPALARAARALARQRFAPEAYEVVVGTDGPDPASARAARAAWRAAGGRAGGLVVVECPRAGYVEVRRRLLPRLRGRLLLSLNDDVEPDRDLLAAHARAHEGPGARGRADVVVGASPFARPAAPTVVDRIAGETSMVFFYDVMTDADRERDWGFRHAFGLNLSAPLDVVRAVGGFTAMPDTYGYDDLELGFRLATRAGARVLYRPEARAVHHHRYRARDLLEREHRLGVAACRYARAHPAFARAVFDRDPTEAAALAEARRLVARGRSAVARLERSFLALDRPAADDDDVHRLYECHRPLKRHVWHEGLLHEADRRGGR